MVWRRILLWGGVAVLLATVSVVGALAVRYASRQRVMRQVRPVVRRCAARNGVPASLIFAVIKQESRFDPRARGAAGEVGLMQITRNAMLDWARAKAVPCPETVMGHDPELNIEIGSWYLGRALRRWEGYADREVLALAEYNAGPGNARKWAPPIRQADALQRIRFPGTRHYIECVLSFRQRFDQEPGNRDQISSDSDPSRTAT